MPVKLPHDVLLSRPGDTDRRREAPADRAAAAGGARRPHRWCRWPAGERSCSSSWPGTPSRRRRSSGFRRTAWWSWERRSSSDGATALGRRPTDAPPSNHGSTVAHGRLARHSALPSFRGVPAGRWWPRHPTKHFLDLFPRGMRRLAGGNGGLPCPPCFRGQAVRGGPREGTPRFVGNDVADVAFLPSPAFAVECRGVLRKQSH